MKRLPLFTSFLLAVNAVFAQTEVLGDGSFEAGTPNLYWNDTSTSLPLICHPLSCGDCPGGCSARTGQWFVWFGGAPAQEIGSIDQMFSIPYGASSAQLTFWVKMPTVYDHDLDTFKCLVDSVTKFEITNADSTTYQADYAEKAIDMTTYADGYYHNLMFWGFQHGAGVTNILVDDVSLTYTNPVGITYNLLSDGIRILPNPARDEISVEVSSAKERGLAVELYSARGELVSAHHVPVSKTGTLHIGVSGLAEGAYLMKINDGLSVISRTMVVAH